jgi:hypothetical protein
MHQANAQLMEYHESFHGSSVNRAAKEKPPRLGEGVTWIHIDDSD